MTDTGIVIEPMKSEHIPGLLQIERESFSKPWTKEGFESELENETAHFLVALKDNSPVGYIGFYAVLDEGYTANIAVLPEYRRQGTASELMTEALKICRDMGLSFLSLEVRKSNKPAHALYEKFGFVKVGERKRFYTSPTEDADILTVYFGEN